MHSGLEDVQAAAGRHKLVLDVILIVCRDLAGLLTRIFVRRSSGLKVDDLTDTGWRPQQNHLDLINLISSKSTQRGEDLFNLSWLREYEHTEQWQTMTILH